MAWVKVEDLGGRIVIVEVYKQSPTKGTKETDEWEEREKKAEKIRETIEKELEFKRVFFNSKKLQSKIIELIAKRIAKYSGYPYDEVYETLYNSLKYERKDFWEELLISIVYHYLLKMNEERYQKYIESIRKLKEKKGAEKAFLKLIQDAAKRRVFDIPLEEFIPI